MTRSVLILNADSVRKLAIEWINKAPDRTRVEFKGPRRTLPQNDRMWAMLTDIADQREHHGRKYSTEVWKCLFLHDLKRELKLIPSLDNTTLIQIAHSSSDLSVEEMSGLIDRMHAWGAENNVLFQDTRDAP